MTVSELTGLLQKEDPQAQVVLEIDFLAFDDTQTARVDEGPIYLRRGYNKEEGKVIIYGDDPR